MASSASRGRRPRAFFAAFASAVVAISAAAQAAEVAAAPEAAGGAPEATLEVRPVPYADRFPNVVLQTHDGRNVRFYDDLLKGKVVVINFFYATCRER